MKFTPYHDMPTPQQTCDNIALAYLSVAYNESHTFATERGSIYRAMHTALINAIMEAYGLTRLMANRVYDVMIDSGESVAYSVRYVKTNRTSSAYEH